MSEQVFCDWLIRGLLLGVGYVSVIQFLNFPAK